MLSFAFSTTLSAICFLLIESIGIQAPFNSLFITVLKESKSISLASFFCSEIEKSIFFLSESPTLSSLNLSKVLLSPIVKKKRIETVK